MDNKKNGIPKLRFPGFTGAWEQRKLGEVADIFDGTHQTPKYTDSGIKFVSVENIATLETEKYISQKAYESEYSNKQAEKGDVLMTRIGNIGTPKLIEKDEPLAYYVTLALLKPKNIDSNFLAWGISSPKVQRNIWKLTLHIAFPKKINLGEINQVSISIPSINEQKKIGDFFKQLDSLIALHQRKLEHLQEQKKGLLQKMFPKNGETVPEVRFPGFTDAWEQRKFNRIFIKNIEKNKGQYTFDKTISIATMHFKKEGNGASKSSLAGYKVLRVGDIAFEGHTSKKFKYGRFVMNDIGDGIMSPRFSALRPVEEISVSFWKQYIHYEPIMRKILVRSTKSGTMMNELVINDLYKESILVPSTEEQKKIGAFFNQLDSLITLHQRKLDHLELMKKGLLQQMFV